MINISFLFLHYSFNFICVGKTTCLLKLHIEENIMQPIALYRCIILLKGGVFLNQVILRKNTHKKTIWKYQEGQVSCHEWRL